MTDTFSTHSRSVLIDLLAGLSEADAATKHGISERTIQRWLRKGRDDPRRGRIGLGGHSKGGCAVTVERWGCHPRLDRERLARAA